MKTILCAASLVAALSTISTAPVYANELMDTVRARANARAGGPTNAYDAWLLERYGRLSGTEVQRGYRWKKPSKHRAAKFRKARKYH